MSHFLFPRCATSGEGLALKHPLMVHSWSGLPKIKTTSPVPQRIQVLDNFCRFTPKGQVGMKTFSIEEALKAQRALRDAAGLGEEQFPVLAFAGMISDEVEVLRNRGETDEEIASIIRSNSRIQITAKEIQENYGSPEERHRH